MANVEHKNLTGASLHEPKGTAAATSGQVYTADGAGSGTWQKYLASNIDTTGAAADDAFYADGAGAGSWKSAPGSVYGAISVANNATATTLGTINTYVKVTAGLTGEHLSGITFTTDHLTVPVTGAYRVDACISLLGQVNDEFHFATSTDGTVAGIVGGVNPHHVKITTADTSSQYTIPLTYHHTFTANDDLYLIVKNITAAADVTVTDMSLTVSLMKES